jgi:hypothetical protein
LGVIRGVYFSEEVKLAIKAGYKLLEVRYGIEFTKERLFEDFVRDIYALKKSAVPFFTKMYTRQL